MSEKLIFISHAAVDSEIAIGLKKSISTAFPNVDIFVSSDPTNLAPGDPWVQKILDALERASLILALVTERGLSRKWVWFESGRAWFSGIKLFPCCLGKVRKSKLEPPFSLIQALNIDAAGDLLILFDQISQILAQPPAETNFNELSQELMRFDIRAEQSQKTLDDPNATAIRADVEKTMSQFPPVRLETLRQFVIHGELNTTTAQRKVRETGANMDQYWAPGALARETSWLVPSSQNTLNDTNGENRYTLRSDIKPYLQEYFDRKDKVQ
ncbi:MAG: toll/interleukin-1 receptor domain-containing protein [Edaphobacter sp.]